MPGNQGGTDHHPGLTFKSFFARKCFVFKAPSNDSLYVHGLIDQLDTGRRIQKLDAGARSPASAYLGGGPCKSLTSEGRPPAGLALLKVSQ